MRLLADENCDRLLVQHLRRAGHDVLFALESLQGKPDAELFRLAHNEGRTLLTDDLDFAHISKVESRRPPAVIIVRLEPLTRMTAIDRVCSTIEIAGDAILGHVVIIEPAQVRLRAFETL